MYNCRLSAASENGLKGICCSSQKQPTVTTPNDNARILNILPRSCCSRNFLQLANTTPDAPKPSKAVDITRKPKWYQSETLITLVSDNSSNNVASGMRKIPMK